RSARPTAHPGAAGTPLRPITGIGAARAGSCADLHCRAADAAPLHCFTNQRVPMSKISLSLATLASALVLSGCVTPGGGLLTAGNAPTAASGAAGGASSVNANESLERCDAPLGTIAVDDGRGKEW